MSPTFVYIFGFTELLLEQSFQLEAARCDMI